MSSLWSTHRAIAYDAAAQTVVDGFTDPHDRFHDQLMGIEWLISRTPGIGVPATKEDRTKNVLAVFRGDELAKTTDVWFLYSYDDDTVSVHGVKVTGNLVQS